MNRINALKNPSQFLLAEFLVVILGVTSAFLGEAWWQNAKDSELERDYLQRLVEDLDYGFETLTRARDWSTMAEAVGVTSELGADTPFLLTCPRWIMKARLSFRLPSAALNPAVILDRPNPDTFPLWIVSACRRGQGLL